MEKQRKSDSMPVSPNQSENGVPPETPPPGGDADSLPKATPKLRYDPQQDEKQYKAIFEDAPKPLLSVIQTIGKYLGEGDHSDIFKGQMVGSKRAVTVKVDRRPLENEENYNAVQDKVNNLKKLHHPGIAELIDFIPDWDYVNPETNEKGRSFIIMQYIPGKGLNQVLIDEGRPRQKRVLNWAIQILGVLRYLHQNQRIAGHIVPSNLVLGPRDRIRIVDFNYISAISDEIRETKPGAKDHSRFGQAPTEQELQAGILSDIQYLGATMFELLTGKPWNPDDEEANEKLFDEANVSPSVRGIIRKALAENYQSAQKMEWALRYLPYQDARFIRHVRHGLAVSALCAFLLALGGFYYVTGQSQLQRVSEMNRNAADASVALQGGDYTNALRLVMEATNKIGFDPPVTADAQAALAEILGVYDYVSGYKPLRSDFKLLGRPQRAAFSPDGDLIAILTNHSDGKKRIQIFNAKSGEEKNPSLEVRSDENCAFMFIGYDTLLYAGKDGLTSCDLKTGTMSVWDSAHSSDAQTGLALSADGKIVAYVVWETRTAYIFNAQTRAITHTLTLEETSGGSGQLQQTFLPPMERMVALDATGQLLAVSLPRGGTGLFPTDGSKPMILSQVSQYRYFEGGFFDHFFFYTASNAWTQGDSESYVQTECRLIDLDTMEAVLELQEPALIHAQADKNGIYLSIGNDLYRVDADNQTWDFLVDVETPILSLHHAAGRLLVITSTKLALVYRDDGAWRVEVARGKNYSIAGLSKNYLFLATPEKALLSVLEWNEKTSFLSYDKGDGKTVYPHWGAHLHADGTTVLLFNKQDFRIYNVETGIHEEYELPQGTVSVSYHRDKTANSDPDGEYLKAVCENSVEFYSAKTGDFLKSRDRNDKDDALTFQSGGWLVRQTSNEPIEISYGGHSKKIDGDELTYVSAQNGYLILSLRTSENERRGLILNQQLDEIANLPGFCEATPDRMLLFDDQQGNLRKGPLYSVEDLRTLANQKLEAEIK
jgi:serine/threonine-protein kinase